MKRIKLFAVTAVLLLSLLIGVITITGYSIINQKQFYDDEVYVGVTYGGSSIQEAKELIDKVKDYTNLFSLTTGDLRTDRAFAEEIGDYAIASNLNYAVFAGLSDRGIGHWLNEAKERWGEHFTGVYYNDEPGGKILDGSIILENTISQEKGYIEITSGITKNEGGAIDCNINGTRITYWPDGRICIQMQDIDEIFEQEYNSSPEERQLINGTIIGSYKTLTTRIDYYSNGTITIREDTREGTIQHLITEHSTFNRRAPSEKDNTNFYTSENITKYPYEIQPYEEVLNHNPIQNYNDVAKAFVNVTNEVLSSRFLNKTQLEESILVFTSDYGLYWWDYQKGYDFILAQLGWNNSITKEIGLVRGAANLQGKSWGTIITWKYTQAPYLPDGNEIYDQMKTSYEAGAKYIAIFNYSEDPTNPNILQEEHFQALERFWKDVVQNPQVIYGGIKAEAALVLPQNYGWGMRNPQDIIWGIWPADSISQQIWNQLQDKIDQYGLKLDIVFEDPNYPVAGKYSSIHYCSQK
ncbi:MAG: hypothetical protein FWG55_04400 [Candidatus Bathyarchaeota archaeon]|nr:hypothetical protein [Candidatus Termiticorpusculum sp.]